MASSIGKVTSFCWELKNFYSQRNNNVYRDITSKIFKMGSVSFALFYHNSNDEAWYSDTYGVILKDLDNKNLIEISLKLWFENEYGQKFYEHSFDKYLFNKAEDRCKLNVRDSGRDWDLFSGVINNAKTLYIRCEITDLQEKIYVPITNCTHQFHQDTWSMYEQEVHDTIIKVGETEFKILKSQFMAHSEFFKNMFSLNFKERETNTVEIKDVSELAMKQLIKWMYTCQIEDQSSIEELFEAANKYQINLLKTNCAELMINSLDNSNAFRRLILAVVFNDKQLKDFTLRYINNMPIMEAAAYLTSSDWIEFAYKKPVFAKEVNELIKDKLKK